MKKGISAWAFTVEDADQVFALAKKYGFDGVEMAMNVTGPVRPDSTKEEMEALKEKAASYGLELYSVVNTLCWGYSLTANDPAIREKGAELIRRQIDVASWMGADTVLVLPGMVEGLDEGGEVVPYEVVMERIKVEIEALKGYAEERKVKIGLENVWNKFLMSPLEMRDLIDSFDSDYVGSYFDVGNVVNWGYPEQWIRILGSRIAKVHFKDFSRKIGTLDGFVDLLTGDVNYPEVLKALSEAGYDGWATAEVFPDPADPEKVLEVNSAAMDKILGRA